MQDFKEIYEKEQKEFKEWAKSLWTSNHCVRALRPKPTIEMVYEAEFKMRANEMAAFPKRYEMAALIPFDNNQKGCEIVFRKTLIKVSNPNVKYYSSKHARKQQWKGLSVAYYENRCR